MPPTTKQRIVADFRRTQILAAATRVFGTKGYDLASMEEIARSARLAKGTLYLYFKSKEAIYHATMQRALAEAFELTEDQVDRSADFAGKLAAFVRVRIAFWDEKQSLYRVMLGLGRDGAHRKQAIAWQKPTITYLEQLLRNAAERGDIPAQDFRAAAWATLDTIRGVNERRVFAEGRSPEEDIVFLTALLLHALQAAPDTGQKHPASNRPAK